MPGEPVVCDDGVGCTSDTCVEPTGTCSFSPRDGRCDDGRFCNGPESCDPALDCRPGTPPSCEDGVGCTSDWCDSRSDRCRRRVNHAACDDALFCNGRETCDMRLDCRPGAPVVCDDGVDCTVDSCDEALDDCAATPDDTLCDDGLFCTHNRCDPEADCLDAPRDCTDTVGCTDDSCDETADTCRNDPDADRCPPPPACQVAICDPLIDCGTSLEPDGTDCVFPPDLRGVCLGGTCFQRGCGDGWLDPGEECDPTLHRLGCTTGCTTFDWVVTDPPGFATDDGREAIAGADRAVAVLDGGGKFVVAWTQDEDIDPFYADVRARILDVIGGVTGPDIEVTSVAMPQQHAVVAALPGGGFAVAWQGYGSDAGAEDVDIYLAVYDRDGRLVRSVRANTTAGEAQLNPSLAVSPADGTVVLAWEDWSRYAEGPDPWGLSAIRYRLFDPDGTAAAGWSSDALANTTTSDAQLEPAVAVLPTGPFLIAWTDASGAGPDTSGTAVRARLFQADGTAVGDDFVVNLAKTTWEQYEPTIAAIEFPEPGWIVAWTDMEDTGRLTVRANFLPEAGGLVAATEVVLPRLGLSQSAPALAAGPGGTIVGLWVQEVNDATGLADTSVAAVAGARFAVVCPPGGPCTLDRRGDGDTVLATTFHDVQETPAAAFGAGGSLALVWTDWSGLDGSGGLNEVRARFLPHGWVLE